MTFRAGRSEGQVLTFGTLARAGRILALLVLLGGATQVRAQDPAQRDTLPSDVVPLEEVVVTVDL